MRAERDNHEQSKPNTGRWAKEWLSQRYRWEGEFTPKQYYEYLRREIEREDGITNQRLTWAMSIQGFLIASMSLLLSGAWPPQIAQETMTVLGDSMLRAVIFRELAIGGIGLIGLLSAMNTYIGIDASRTALDKVKRDWHTFNDIVKIVPEMAVHAFGHDHTSRFGSLYARAIPVLFCVLWFLYLIVYCMILLPSLLSHILML